MTTYENMFGIGHQSAPSLNSAFTSTGAPLDPSHHLHSGPSSSSPSASAGNRHKHGGFLGQWGKLLGLDAFIETATGRGAATNAKNKRRKKNPYSRGCIANCRDFWCDPAPVFGSRDTGSAVLGGVPVNYTEMYESPALMELTAGPEMGMGRRNRGYQQVAGDEV